MSPRYSYLIQKEEAESADSMESTAEPYQRLIWLLMRDMDAREEHRNRCLNRALPDCLRYGFIPLVGNQGLKELAKIFDTSKQTFSKRLLKLNKELHIRSRNQKSSEAVETYR